MEGIVRCLVVVKNLLLSKQQEDTKVKNIWLSIYSGSHFHMRGICMDQKKIYDELDYHMAQEITEKLYQSGFISFVEYDKLTDLNRRSFSPLFADLLPKTLDKSKQKA